jgi:hypothetical protein
VRPGKPESTNGCESRPRRDQAALVVGDRRQGRPDRRSVASKPRKEVSKSAVRSIKRSLPRRQLSPGNRVKEEPSPVKLGEGHGSRRRTWRCSGEEPPGVEGAERGQGRLRNRRDPIGLGSSEWLIESGGRISGKREIGPLSEGSRRGSQYRRWSRMRTRSEGRTPASCVRSEQVSVGECR